MKLKPDEPYKVYSDLCERVCDLINVEDDFRWEQVCEQLGEVLALLEAVDA